MLTLAVGLLSKEIVLTLIGFISIFLLGYLLAQITILANYYKKNARFFSCTILPAEAVTGDTLRFELWIQNLRHIFPLSIPGIFTTYEVRLVSKDHKIISVSMPIPRKKHFSVQDPDSPASLPSVPIGTIDCSRGVYYAERDSIVLFDLFGFYFYSIPVLQNQYERLIIGPKPALDSIAFQFQIGGSNRREELMYQRTEDLIEHRPYVPGDDPRRINWKLFGHSGDLFVRQEELEPPPVAEYILVLDTSVDHHIFSDEEGQLLVDALSRTALALSLELGRKRFSINLWFPKSELKTPEEANIAKTLAYPYAVDLADTFSIPDFSRETSLFILALPRTIPSPDSALEKILHAAPNPRQVYFINPAIVLNRQVNQDSYKNCIRYYGNYYAT